MSTPVREIGLFYEATGPFAVDPALAERTFGLAADIVGRHAGPIALTDVNALAIAPSNDIFRVDEVPDGPTMFTSLMTRRPVRGSDGTVIKVGGTTNSHIYGGRVVYSKNVISLPAVDCTGATGVVSTVHEWGHSFGLTHCPPDTCVMQPKIRLRERANEILMSGNVFCAPCIRHLATGMVDEIYR